MQQKRLNRRLRRRLHPRHSTKLTQTRRRWQHPSKVRRKAAGLPTTGLPVGCIPRSSANKFDTGLKAAPRGTCSLENLEDLQSFWFQAKTSTKHPCKRSKLTKHSDSSHFEQRVLSQTTAVVAPLKSKHAKQTTEAAANCQASSVVQVWSSLCKNHGVRSVRQSLHALWNGLEYVHLEGHKQRRGFGPSR